MLNKLRTLGWDFQLKLLAVAAVLLGIPLARAEISHLVVLPELVYVIVGVTGAALSAVALGGVILLIVDRLLGDRRAWFECRPVARRNVQNVFELMRDFFGDETPTVTRMAKTKQDGFDSGVSDATNRRTKTFNAGWRL